MNEIRFRFTELADGQIKIDCAVDPEETKGLASAWSHMTTVPDEHQASIACRDEVLYQFDNNEDWRDAYTDGGDNGLAADVTMTEAFG